MSETVCAYLLGSDPEVRQIIAKQLGKKGVSSDIALYNYAKDFTLQIVDPLRYPDKALTIFETIFMTDVPVIILPQSGPDVYTGEFVLLLSALGYTNGIFVFPNEGYYMPLLELEKKIKKLFKGLLAQDYPILEIDFAKGETFNKLRDMIREQSKKAPRFNFANSGDSRVDIDHVFPVTGIGTVILGRVRAGKVIKGEQMHVFPSKRVCTIRSIQINDVDFKEAVTGTRVGLALKGLLTKDVERGYLLSNNTTWNISNEITVTMELMPYAAEPEVGKSRHIICGLQASPVKITKCETIDADKKIYSLSLKLEKELVFHTNEIALLIDLNGKPKTVGRCTING